MDQLNCIISHTITDEDKLRQSTFIHRWALGRSRSVAPLAVACKQLVARCLAGDWHAAVEAKDSGFVSPTFWKWPYWLSGSVKETTVETPAAGGTYAQ